MPHGPSILRSHRGPSSPEHIHPEDPSPHGPWGPIHPCPWPIHAKGLSISEAHEGPTMRRANPLGLSIPRVPGDPSMRMAHPSRWPTGFNPYPKTHGPIFSGPIYSEGLSLPRAHTSLHRADGGPSGLSMHRCLGPTHSQCPSILKVYGTHSMKTQDPSLPRAQPCRSRIHAQGLSMPRAHPRPWPIYPEGRWGPNHAQGPESHL